MTIIMIVMEYIQNEDKNKLIEGYLKDCFIVNNINKKIQAQSNYKINDIKEICKKLQIL